jgi:hypothetical protein
VVLLRGWFRILFLYDVAEAFDLAKIQGIIGTRGAPLRNVLPRRSPQYMHFANPPIEELAEPVTLASGEELACSIKYHAYAVAVVQLDVPFSCDWSKLLEQASRWMDSSQVEPLARGVLSRHLQRVTPAILKPNAEWLEESYLIVSVQSAQEADGSTCSGAGLLATHRDEIAQLVRGESSPLSSKATEEALQASLSYYPSDLVVIGASGALVVDHSDDAAATGQVLEYAKMQLLEFRYYDGLMTKVLSDVYDVLERKRNVLLARWSLPREAHRVNTIRLDVMELTERIDNSIKFVSDIYYARVYHMASARIGLPDYRNLVDEKLRAVGEMYDFMMDQFSDARSFVIEMGIAILALLDVILLFRGR